MDKVTNMLGAKLDLAPDKLSIDEVIELAKQKRGEMNHDCCLVVTFKSTSTKNDNYNVSVFGIDDRDVFHTLLDMAGLFYEMK